MNKLKISLKMMFLVAAVTAILPVSNLSADWETEYDAWIEGTGYYSNTTSHWSVIEFGTGNLSDDNTQNGYSAYGWIRAFTESDMWSEYENYSNSISAQSSVWAGIQKDWEWDGPPSTAPGADISIYLSASSPYGEETQTWSEISAQTSSGAYAYAMGLSLSEIFCRAWESWQAYDDDGVYGICASSVDTDSNWILGYEWIVEPDEYYWTPNPYNNALLADATLLWYFETDLNYEVQSQVPFFTCCTVGYLQAYSESEISTSSSQEAQAWSDQNAYISFYTSCEMTSN